jgi:hypothetical protein
MQGRIHIRAHRNPLTGRHIDPVQPDATRVHRMVIERIRHDRPPFPPVDGTPVEGRDLAEIAPCSSTDRAGILLCRVHPVGEAVVGRDVVDLLGVLVIPQAPRCAAVERDDRALVVAKDDTVAVRGIDPSCLRIVAPRCPPEPGEGGAAIGGLVRRGVQGVDEVGIRGIDVDAAVVPALPVANALVVGIHLAPGGAPVVRSEQAIVGDGVDALAVGIHGDRDGGPPVHAWNGRAGERSPREAPVVRSVDPSAGGSVWRWRLRRVDAAGRKRRDVEDGRRRKHDLRSVGGRGQSRDARRVTNVQCPSPRRAAVGAAEDAARRALAELRPERSHQHGVRIARIDEDRRHALGILEPDVVPGLARVDRAIDAVALGELPLPRDGLAARSDVHDVGVRRCDRNGADGRDRGDGVENRKPGLACARGLPDTTGCRSEVERARFADHTGDGRHAAAAERSDVAPRESVEQRVVNGPRACSEEECRRQGYWRCQRKSTMNTQHAGRSR